LFKSFFFHIICILVRNIKIVPLPFFVIFILTVNNYLMFNTNLFFNSGSISGPVQTEFSSNGTWCCPLGTYCVRVCVAGGGGGGGGGGWTNASNSWAAGGGGGGGGGFSYDEIPFSCLASTVPVVVGGGGGGGAAGTFPNNGSAGSGGGVSCFGTLVSANGGSPGGGGQANCQSGTATGSAGVGGTGLTSFGGAGGRGLATSQSSLTGENGVCANTGGGGGGGGGASKVPCFGPAGANRGGCTICGWAPTNNGGGGGNAGASAVGGSNGSAGSAGKVIVTAYFI
jgi:hypothetical protein